MKFFLKNITNWPTDPGDVTQTCKHLLIDGERGYSGVVVKPQEICIVSDTGKDHALKYFPQYVQIIGPAPDASAPYQKTVVTPATWTLIDLGAYFNSFHFIPSANNVISISYSGFDATNILGGGVQTAPPSDTIITIPSGQGEIFHIDEVLNPTRYIYVKGTAGTETLYIYAY